MSPADTTAIVGQEERTKAVVDTDSDTQRKIEFLIWRRLGMPPAHVVAQLTEAEHDQFLELTDTATRNAMFDECQSMAAEVLDREYAAELDRFEFESSKYTKAASQAQFEAWARLPAWRLADAVALVAGLEPHRGLLEWAGPAAPFYPKAAEVMRRWDAVLRAHEAGQLRMATPPAEFLAWAAANMTAPDQVIAAVEGKVRSMTATQERVAELEHQLANALADLAELEADLEAGRKRSAKTMLRIIGAIAVGKYRHDPSKGHTETATKMASTLSDAGFDFSDRRLRPYVKDGVNELQAWKKRHPDGGPQEEKRTIP